MNQRTKAFIEYTVMALTALIASFVAYKVISSSNVSSMAKEINELNSKLPIKIDELTTLNRIDAKNDIVYYHYELSVNVVNHPNLKSRLETNLGITACNKEFKVINDQFPITMEYLDVTGALIGSFDFKKGYCD
jgi:hypothetical protein